MCLAVPGRVERVEDDAGLRVARVAFGGPDGVCQRVCLETLPEAREGDWILVHAGFALSVVDEDAAEEMRRWLGDEAAPA